MLKEAKNRRKQKFEFYFLHIRMEEKITKTGLSDFD